MPPIKSSDIDNYVNCSDAQSAVFRQIAEPITRAEWEVDAVYAVRGSLIVGFAFGGARMHVLITRSGTVPSVNWRRAQETQSWESRRHVEERWRDGYLTFGWERPAIKDIITFCRSWVAETNTATGELDLLRQQLAAAFDRTNTQSERIRRLEEQLSDLKKRQAEDLKEFFTLAERVAEIKAADTTPAN